MREQSVRLRIAPTRGLRWLNLRELWDYRELVYFLTWRDIKVRYKQTVIGVGWVLLQPLLLMAVFTVFLRHLAFDAKLSVPYPLFAFAGLLPWQLFARTLTESTNSLITDQKLVTRVYFPRLIIPIACTAAALVDFFISFLLYAALTVIYHVPLPVTAVWLPLFFVLMVAAALGVGFWLSALNVEYRDVAYTIPFLAQIWLFLTPVVYPSSLVPAQWRFFYALNPMVGVVDGFRWALLGAGNPPGLPHLLSAAIAVVLCISGIVWFRWRERVFIDVIGSGGR